jgi:hypothetical protein
MVLFISQHLGSPNSGRPPSRLEAQSRAIFQKAAVYLRIRSKWLYFSDVCLNRLLQENGAAMPGSINPAHSFLVCGAAW